MCVALLFVPFGYVTVIGLSALRVCLASFFDFRNMSVAPESAIAWVSGEMDVIVRLIWLIGKAFGYVLCLILLI